MSFTLDLKSESSTSRLSFIGSMSQCGEQLGSLRIISANEIVMDFQDLKSINSVGIREFGDWIRKLPNHRIAMVFCRKVLIDQINMIPNFLPDRVKIKSFYVPYYSEQTETSDDVLFCEGVEYARNKQGALEIKYPAIKGPAGEPLYPDIDERRYFKFMQQHA